MSESSPLDTDAQQRELLALRAEVERLRALVGPTEESYGKLRLDVLGARDAAIAAEAELGRARARISALETDVARYRRDFVLLRRLVIRQMARGTRVVSLARRAVGVAARTARR
jgi:hypothetical protein